MTEAYQEAKREFKQALSSNDIDSKGYQRRRRALIETAVDEQLQLENKTRDEVDEEYLSRAYEKFDSLTNILETYVEKVEAGSDEFEAWQKTADELGISVDLESKGSGHEIDEVLE